MTVEITEKNRELSLFSEYCRLKEKGLRKQAFEKLSDFLIEFQKFSFDQKKEFTIFIFELIENEESFDNKYISHPLSEELKKVLVQWMELEGKNSNPFRWFGIKFQCWDVEYFNRALEINPADEKARIYIINIYINRIWNATHHLPDYFIGNSEDSSRAAEIVKSHIAKLSDTSKQEYFLNRLNQEMILVENYRNWETEKTDLDFKAWYKLNNRKFDSGVIAYYYDK
ncbi:MAG TPA: hypothetical protein PKY59_09910 [Pyrinomonadaceae bacterium]|nr:hypothetical protein [Pyrinomonadaceae bacterium]